MDQWIRLISKAEVIGLDTESTGLEVYDDTDRALGFSISFRTDAGVFSDYFPIGHSIGPNLEEADWRTLLEAVLAKPVIFQNAIHDLSVLAGLGYNTDKIKFYDTLKLGHLINENEFSYSLDATTAKWLGYKGKQKSPMWELALHTYGWDMPSGIMYDYAKADANIALLSLEAMAKDKEWTPQLMEYWQKIEAPAINLLTKMRRAGVLINVEKCKVEEAKGVARMEELQDELGGNPASPIWLSKTLIGELGLPEILKKETGKRTFDKAAMKRYEVMLSRIEGQSELAGKILEYRGWQKAVSGYYQAYQRYLSSDGRLRAEYKPHGTVTGRFSCADPNLQQIPKETNKEWNKNVKSVIIATPGYTLWEFDYKQLEFRLAASASKEQRLLEVFADPSRDIFTEMASHLGMERDPTKTLNYTLQYGGGKGRISDVFGVSRYEAEDIIYNYFEQYPNLKKAGDYMASMARNKKYIQIWSGRRRHFKFADEDYKALNSYIQGGAADLVKMVMVKIDQESLNNKDCGLRLQVHDSLVFEIKNGMEDYYGPKIIEAMVSPKFGVTLAVDMHEWSKN